LLLTNTFISSSAFDWSLDFWDVLGIVIKPCWTDQRISTCPWVFPNLIIIHRFHERKNLILLFCNFTNSFILNFLSVSQWWIAQYSNIMFTTIFNNIFLVLPWMNLKGVWVWLWLSHSSIIHLPTPSHPECKKAKLDIIINGKVISTG